jgi:hypothetical protein
MELFIIAVIVVGLAIFAAAVATQEFKCFRNRAKLRAKKVAKMKKVFNDRRNPDITDVIFS